MLVRMIGRMAKATVTILARKLMELAKGLRRARLGQRA